MNSERPSERWALGVEYLGTNYHGWQLQKQSPLASIEGRLQWAYQQIAHRPVELVAAGRTDAGVHAMGQVVHFDTCQNLTGYQWLKALNRYLPSDIAINWVQAVPKTFHARYSALAREYEYWLALRPGRGGLWAQRMLYWPQLFSAEKVSEALKFLTGEKDFSSFRAKDCQSLSPFRNMMQAQLVELDSSLFKFIFKANAFLHHMVRNIVGSLLWIGGGQRSPSWMSELLECKDRRKAGPTAPAQGLHLSHVGYDEELPENFRSPWRS